MRHQRIQNGLNNSFSVIHHFELTDESHLHAGRKGQESHFKLLLVSDDFLGQSRVQRQRKINQLLADEFNSGLHALAMRLLTQEEWEKRSTFKTPDCSGGED